jgi:ABC-type dipeptide/oligopeptide/nickel transport system permease component
VRYVVWRIVQAVPLLAGLLVLNFFLIHLAPGDPIYTLAGQSGDERYYAEMRARFGLDRPLLEQLTRYVGNMLGGDFGYSFAFRQPALQVVLARIPATLLLMVPGLTLATVVGIWLGVEAGRRSTGWIDTGISIVTLIGASMPAFWLGQLLILVFAYSLGVLPVQGMSTARGGYQGFAYALDVARHMVLPVMTLGLLQLALITRLTRTAVADVLVEEYVRTARAKGLRDGSVVYGHAFRNALLPVVTTIGGQIGTLMAGAALTEIVFAWPGLGRLLYEATLGRDYPLLMAAFLILSVAVVLANLLTDLAYAALDPRVRYR